MNRINFPSKRQAWYNIRTLPLFSVWLFFGSWLRANTCTSMFLTSSHDLFMSVATNNHPNMFELFRAKKQVDLNCSHENFDYS